jgi:hypothetical protein
MAISEFRASTPKEDRERLEAVKELDELGNTHKWISTDIIRGWDRCKVKHDCEAIGENRSHLKVEFSIYEYIAYEWYYSVNCGQERTGRRMIEAWIDDYLKGKDKV